jgi:hypothetical protein
MMCILIVLTGAVAVLWIVHPMNSSPPARAAGTVAAVPPPREFPIATTMPVEHDLIAEEFERRGIVPAKVQKPDPDALKTAEGVTLYLNIGAKLEEWPASVKNKKFTCVESRGEEPRTVTASFTCDSIKDGLLLVVRAARLVGEAEDAGAKVRRCFCEISTPDGTAGVVIPMAEARLLGTNPPQREYLDNFIYSIDVYGVRAVEERERAKNH